MIGRRQAVLLQAVSSGAQGALTFATLLLTASIILATGTNLAIRGNAGALAYAAEISDFKPVIHGANADEATLISNAMSSLTYDIDSAAIVVWVIEENGDGTSGAYLRPSGVILIKRSALHENADQLPRILAHEIGHLIDDRFMTDSDRAAFSNLRDYPPSLDWAAWSMPWEARPAEDFAEVFAVLADLTTDTGVTTQYGRPQDTEALRDVIASILPDGAVEARETGVPGILLQALEYEESALTDNPIGGPLIGFIGLAYTLGGVRHGIKRGRTRAHTRGRRS